MSTNCTITEVVNLPNGNTNVHVHCNIENSMMIDQIITVPTPPPAVPCPPPPDPPSPTGLYQTIIILVFLIFGMFLIIVKKSKNK